MKYGGATIGWAVSSTMYETHPLSGDFSSKNVGCEFSSSYSAIIYKISELTLPKCDQCMEIDLSIAVVFVPLHLSYVYHFTRLCIPDFVLGVELHSFFIV